MTIPAQLLALALNLQPMLCATPDGMTVWIEDVDCGAGYWPVCRTGDYAPAATIRACCLWANPGVCRLTYGGASCTAVERHRCDAAPV